MKKRRYSGTDFHFWPFTLSKHSHQGYRPAGIVLDSGAFDGESGDCHIKCSAFGYTLVCELPKIISDYRVRHQAKSWDAATIARIGRDWYDEVFSREFGFTFSEGSLHLYFGAQTHDSRTDQNKVIFLPWRNLRFIRTSLYDLKGEHFHTEFDQARNSWTAMTAVRDACPKARFDFEDFDGQRISATTHIEEREWLNGTGLFRWLAWFKEPQIERSLYLDFSAEVGREKGSWKGGALGHSITMLPGELHEAAFKRYCDQEDRSKSGGFRVRYVGRSVSEAA